MKRPSSQSSQNVSVGATMFIVCSIQFMVPFLLSAVGVALPVIGREMNASAVQLSLIQTALVLAISSLMLPAGRFADIYGRKRVFTAGIVLYTLTTLALALVTSIEVFIALRFIQGMGSAMIFSTSIAILTEVVPPGKRGRAMGLVVANVYIGMAIGPTISGVIITQLGWRWVFFLMLPVELLAFWLTIVKLKGEWVSNQGESFDWTGTIAFIASLVILISGATQLMAFGSAKWVALCGLVGLGIFFKIEQNKPFPLLDTHLLKTNLSFTFSNLATFINYAASYSVTFYFSLYLQYAKGYTPQTTGLILMVQPSVQAILAPLSGRLSDSYPPERIATIGMALCCAGLFAAATINIDTRLSTIIIVILLLGMGFGLFSSPNMTAIMGSVEKHHYGTAASMVQSMRSLGILSSTVIVAIIFSLYLGGHAITQENIATFVQSMRTAMAIFTVMSLIGVVFSMAKGSLATSITGRLTKMEKSQ
jgi:MFS family permease